MPHPTPLLYLQKDAVIGILNGYRNHISHMSIHCTSAVGKTGLFDELIDLLFQSFDLVLRSLFPAPPSPGRPAVQTGWGAAPSATGAGAAVQGVEQAFPTGGGA